MISDNKQGVIEWDPSLGESNTQISGNFEGCTPLELNIDNNLNNPQVLGFPMEPDYVKSVFFGHRLAKNLFQPRISDRIEFLPPTWNQRPLQLFGRQGWKGVPKTPENSGLYNPRLPNTL